MKKFQALFCRQAPANFVSQSESSYTINEVDSFSYYSFWLAG